MTAPTQEADDLYEYCGSDGMKWAEQFRLTAIRLGYSDMDQGWLCGWFANAIESSIQVRCPPALRPASDVGEAAVKALEWRGSENVWHKADAEFGGAYRITQYVGMQKPFKLETHGWWSGSPCGHYEFLDQAKAAAQADYDRRIRSALATPVRSPDAGVADRIIGQIEERFPDWRSYRDLIDCIDCTLHALSQSRQQSAAREGAVESEPGGEGWAGISSRPERFDSSREHQVFRALSSPQPPEQETVRVTDEGERRKLFEAWTRQHPAVWNLAVIKANGAFHHYVDPETDNAWIGFDAALSTALASARPEGWKPTHRHKKTSGEYELLGIGKMQAARWLDELSLNGHVEARTPVDMREVAIYRSNDGKLWARPREEFEDGRFEEIAATPVPVEAKP